MKYLLSILFIVTLVACKPATKQETTNPYFEGFVEFKNTYTSANSRFTESWQRQFGVKTITYISKDGFFSRERIDSNNIIVLREIYRPDSMRFYLILTNSDTIYSSNVTRNKPPTVYMGTQREHSFKILNHTVEAGVAITSVAFNNSPDSLKIRTTYYNDVNYRLHPNIYKGAVLGAVEQIFTRSPYLSTGTVIDYIGKGTISYFATRIVPSTVPGWHFEIPKNKIIVYN